MADGLSTENVQTGAGEPRAHTRATLRVLLGLAAPVVLSRLLMMSMGLVDTIVVGHRGANDLAALALGWAVTSPILVGGIGLLQGVQILSARYYGAGDMRSAAAVLRQGLWYAVFLGVIFATLVVAFIHPILTLLRQPPELTERAAGAAIILALSMPMSLAATAAAMFLEGLSRPWPGMIVMLVANIVNLVLNLWLVGGGYGVEAMGAIGSACATFGARVGLIVLLIAYIFWGPHARVLGVRTKMIPAGPIGGEMRRIGYAAGLSQFFEAGAFAGMNFIAGWSGALAVASYAVALNVSSMAFMIPMGLAAATGVLTSQAIGAAAAKNALHAASLGLRATFVICLTVEAAMALFARPIAGIYASEAALLAATAPLLILTAVTVLPDGLQVVAAAALRAMGINWFPTISHFVAYLGVMIPLGVFLSWNLGHGAAGLIEAIIIASFLSAGVLILRIVWLAQTMKRAHG